jgi:hypothetical protein
MSDTNDTDVSSPEEVVDDKNENDPEEAATDAAVKDIVRGEGDEVLADQDAKAEKSIVMKPKLWERLKEDIYDWWDNPRERYITLGIILALIIAVFSFPATRSYVMNMVGFRGNVQLKVLDGSTTLPLKNATVELAGKTVTTDQNGLADIRSVHLGNQALTVSKSAFATTTEVVQVVRGGQSLSNVSLKAVGTQYGFSLTDYVSGKAVTSAEVSSGKATAEADKTGKALLTVQANGNNLNIQITAKGYRTEKLSVKAGTKTTNVSLVPSGKDIFISKQSGKYDLYSSDLDGTNKKVILAATGNETQAVSLLVSPDQNEAALVSTRDNQGDSDGYLLSTLTIVDVSTGASTTLEHAEAINLMGWSGTRLVYGQTVAGASAANPNRQKISAYDYAAKKRAQLAAANYFNGNLLVGNVVYYAVSGSDPSVNATFAKINADGTSKQTIVNQQVWTLVRTDYGTLSLQSPSGWLSYTIGSTATKAGMAPDDYMTRIYVDNTAASQSLWVDQRDGKGVLLNHDISSNKDTVVTTQSGSVYPLRWINDSTVLYRTSDASGTADYVVSTVGGQPHKVSDVTGS